MCEYAVTSSVAMNVCMRNGEVIGILVSRNPSSINKFQDDTISIQIYREIYRLSCKHSLAAEKVTDLGNSQISGRFYCVLSKLVTSKF